MRGGDSEPPTPPPPPPPPPEAADPGPDPDADPAAAEALRLLAMAEARLASASALKSALKYAKRAARLRPGVGGGAAAALVAALRVLRADPADHYGVLRLPPLSSAAAIRRRYKALALDLHPDRSPFPAAAEEAFKRVAESFRVLSDRSLKRRLDLRLRLRLRRRSPPPEEEEEQQPPRAATFWTACATCRLLHEFPRRYVGYRLVCPSCRKSFLAVEVPNPGPDNDDEAEDAEQEEGEEEPEENGDGDDAEDNKSRVRARVSRVTKSRSSSQARVSRFPPLARQKRRIEPRLSNSPSAASKKPRTKPEKTLAEMQMELSREKKRKERKGNAKPLLTPKEEEEEEEENDSSLMVVEDSDFYDFDKDRSERSFRKGQIWAIYDDDDGMPRHYGLIEEVVSSDPFRVRMNWLDVENHGDEQLLVSEKSGLHVSCGRFKIGRKVEIRSVNLYSHLIDCERAARELFRVYPKKGSVWALYGDWNVRGEERRRRYDIVVLLTSYSDMYGVSTAYLEKVAGYKSVFKRREVGALAIRCIEKEDVRVLSHQIPARKLSGTEGLDLPRDCWELDPASLPTEMLSITWE